MPELNRNEMEAMRILWEDAPLKPSEIQERFSWEIENATLRSALGLLVEKKLVAREKRGKAYYYQARGTRESMLSSVAKRMAHVFTRGSTAGLITQLIRHEKLSAEEIEDLRRLAAERADETRPASRRRH